MNPIQIAMNSFNERLPEPHHYPNGFVAKLFKNGDLKAVFIRSGDPEKPYWQRLSRQDQIDMLKEFLGQDKQT